MAKKISKDINSQFMPTYINGIPTYMYGGKMKYGLGSWLKSNAGNILQTGAGIGSMFIPGGQVAGLGMMASGVGGMAQGDTLGKQSEQIQQQQQDMLKQQLISNLPAQSSYTPTFANGGKINNRSIGQVADNFYDTQSIYTKALANKYPNIPIKDILGKSAQDSTFSNRNLDQYANNLISTYGDFHLKPNEMDSVRNMAGSDIRNIQDSIAGYDPKDVMLQGSKEQNDPNYKFGPRMMLQRLYKKGQSPYKALDEFANGGEITDRVTSIDNGGLHTENGGVPIGQSALVERDEYIYTNKQGKKYVFTDKF